MRVKGPNLTFSDIEKMVDKEYNVIIRSKKVKVKSLKERGEKVALAHAIQG